MLTFEKLTEARRSLQSFCLLHVPSLLSLKSGVSFRLLPSDDPLQPPNKARHLTTSATCYSSLLESPFGFRNERERVEIENDRSKFAKMALARSKKKWVSEGSAGIYCRCRALPMVISSSSSYDDKIKNHIAEIFLQLDKRPDRFGIGEAGAAIKEGQWYPPNAFHTYWTLETLEAIKRTFYNDYERLLNDATLNIEPRREGMILWARQQLGYQIGLHSASPQSSVLDTDQLAWSLAIFLRFDDDLNVNLEDRDFTKQALKCLFSTQTDGTWRHYKPLFHYKEAGNAYCYVFETFAALLLCALRDTAEALMIRALLKPYGEHLMGLWEYAISTKIPLYSGRKEIGWCSGHRTNVEAAESWATASVFSYTQALRRLVGIWCREEALNSLNTPHIRQDPQKATETMTSRGETWGMNRTSISEQLQTLFINPVRMHECMDRLEPDNRPIARCHARSAILFGPPGTSKTTLIRLLADAIEWDYVEIHASHFVAEGLTQVQKTADTIFKQLLELDHSVVLFDEIDELVRERDMEKDAFGRFLTTSMLPKLAELWAARKILYFVATNHINYFDSAIIRSHRFDALMLVSPPSYSAKVDELKRLLSNVQGLKSVGFEITEQQVQHSLDDLGKSVPGVANDAVSGDHGSRPEDISDWQEQKLDKKFLLAKFALLRWDELNELAYRLSSALRARPRFPHKISLEILIEALEQIDDSEWRKNKSYLDYLRDTRSERRDYQMMNVWEVESNVKNSISGVVEANRRRWLAKAVDSPQDIEIPGFELIFQSSGRVQIRLSKSK